MFVLNCISYVSESLFWKGRFRRYVSKSLFQKTCFKIHFMYWKACLWNFAMKILFQKYQKAY